jgi:hypothetical protein
MQRKETSVANTTGVYSPKTYQRRRKAAVILIILLAAGWWYTTRPGMPGIPGLTQGASTADALNAYPGKDPGSVSVQKMQAAMQSALDWSTAGGNLTKWQAPAKMHAAKSTHYVIITGYFKGVCYAIGNAPGYDSQQVRTDPSKIRGKSGTLKSLNRALRAWEKVKPVK